MGFPRKDSVQLMLGRDTWPHVPDLIALGLQCTPKFYLEIDSKHLNWNPGIGFSGDSDVPMHLEKHLRRSHSLIGGPDSNRHY